MIGKRIRDRRIELKLTQEDLAKKAGFKTKGAISRIENNQRDITQSQVVDFAKALNTTPSYLMGWDNEEYLLNQDEITIVDNYRDSNKEGQNKILNYSKDIKQLYPYEPSREEMIEYIKEYEIGIAALSGYTSENEVDDDMIISIYRELKDQV